MRQTKISRRNFYIPITVLSVSIFLALTVFVRHEQVSANVFERLNNIAEEQLPLMFGKQPKKEDDDSAEPLTVNERVVFSANGKIAFASNRDGNSEIYVMNADGSNPVRLTTDAAEDYAPAWSSDGTRIAFVSRRDGNDEIYLMNADGSEQTRLTNETLEDIEPAFSPDGTRLAFASRRDGDFELFTYDLTTFITTQLTVNTFSDSRPSWSPDSFQIAFTSNRDGDSEIFTMTATAGGAATQRTSNTVIDIEPSWSPDGGRIVYSNNLNGNFEIYSYNIFTNTQTRLTNNSIADGQPVWSPDGAKIIFQTNRDLNNEIYSMNADGTVPVRLTSNSFDEAYPAMQPVPTLRINDVTTSEPANGTATATFTVSLSVKYPQPVSVIYTTADDSAAAPGDYLSDNNILVFNANETSKTISITVNSDAEQENFENFFVDLSSATNAVIADAQGRGTIRPPIYNGRIAFASNRDGNYEIYTANQDGSDPVRLTTNTTTDTNPAWSTDGTRIAFQSSRDGNVEVYVMNANGTNQTRLTNNASTDGSAAWSPDGMRLAFASNRDGAFKIFSVNADGTNLVRLTDNIAADDLPAWSSDGTKLIFSSLRHGATYEIYSMNADGTNQIRLTTNTANDLEPQWSLDGSKIVFSTLRDGNSEIYSMNPDGSSPLRLTNNTTVDSSPWWSPDGSRIVFVAARDGNNEIYTMNANGTNPQRLTTNTFVDEQPSWQSDAIPRPDLRPTAATVPPNVTTDLAFNVEWSDLNEGVTPINGNWTDKIYFSTDNQLGSGDILLAEKSVSAALAPNQSVNLTQSVTIPWSAITTNGNYFIFIQTDANSEQAELDETDNVVSLSVGVQRSLRPDLTIDQITAPASVNSGQFAHFEWRVKNIGNGTTGTANWTDWIYLSSDDVPNTTDPVKVAVSHTGSLAADGTYTASADVLIPANLTAGSYRIIVYTDFDGSDNRNGIFDVVEGNETNNYNIARPIRIDPFGSVTFAGGGCSSIPDTGICDVTFNVSGVTGGITSVGTDFNASHTFVGDLVVTLIAPNNVRQHVLFSRYGGTRELSSANNYAFTDAATVSWFTRVTQGDPIPGGQNRTIVNTATVTSLNQAFAGLTPQQINGTWTLRFDDQAAQDSGTIAVKNLTLGVSCATTPTGLVSWWAGDNNTFDYQGNNIGTLGGNANFAGGKVQSAFNFDGDDDFVSIADNDTLDVQTGDFSMDGWVNLRSSREHFIGGKDNCDINSYALTVGADNKPRFRVNGSDGSFEVVAANAVTLNAWHHLAAVKEGSNIKIYVNGVLAGTEAVTGTFAANDQNFRIGGRAAASESCPLVSTDGLIDELDVFDRALTLTEVQTIFGADSGGKCRPAMLLSIDPNPVIGGRTATGTFTLSNPAPAGGAVITLTSGDPSIATVPASITIPENQTSGTFAVTTPSRSADAPVIITGAYNGLSKTTTLVVARSVPDLRVTSATAPAEVNTASAFDVGWTDLNAGVVATSSNWTDEVFFSTNNVLDGTDRSLGRFSFTGPLTPDQSGSLTGSVTIPPSAITADGNYFLIIRTDTLGNVNEGSFETNNTFVKPIRVLRRAPDLQVSSVTPPAEINTTEAFSVSWTDKNFGNASAAPSWNDQVYFSTDNQIGSDILLGNLGYTGTLAPDGSIDRTLAALTIPPSAIPATGDYFIYVRTDSGSVIDEGGGTNENNNVTFRPVRVNLIAPDLQVSNIHTPTEVGTTTSFNLTWTDKNFGNARANASWTDSVYFSSNNTVGSDVLLGSINVNTSLDPNQTVDSTLSVTIPTSAITADGDYFIYVQTDRNNNVNEGPLENNNVTFKPIRVLLRTPDLQVTAVNAAPEVETEQEFEVAWTVANTGVVRANPTWTDCVYFSQDNQPGSDTNIGCFDFSQGLDPNQTAQRIQNVRVPLSSITQTGNYFFYVQTDVNNTVDEGTAGNNNNRSQFRPLRVRRTLRPDLTVPSVVAPNQAFFDQGIQVQWTVTNAGPGATNGEWIDQIYLSTDQTISGDDRYLGARQNVSYLNAGESYIVSADVNIPRGVFGNLFIIVRTDGGNSVGEDNDTNNTRAKAINILVPPLPDLQVPFVQAPEEAFAGQPMLVNWRVENRGTGNMSPQQNNWVDRIYLSQDTTFNPAVDRLIGTRTNAVSLAQNAGYTVNGFSVTLPLNIIGDWYVFVVTDDSNRIYEFNAENNNFNYDSQQPGSPVMIRATPPDLAIPTAPAAPETANAGTTVAVSFTVRNQGAFDATPNWYDKIYLSSDQTLDTATDTALATIYRPAPLGAGLQYTVTTTVNIPACLSGTYYLFALTDSGNQIFEFDMKVNAEANNSSQPKQIQITNTPPDLRVITVANPATGTAGQPVQIDWTVANTGTGATLTGDWYDRVLLSASPTLGNGTQVSLGSFLRTGTPLAPNANYTRSAVISLPANLQGAWYVFVNTDQNGGVQECTGENNNSTAGSTTLNVANQTLNNQPDLRVSNITPSTTSARPGDTIQIQWTGANNGTQDIPLSSSWNDSVYYSTDPTLSDNDTLLGTALIAQPLAVGATYQAQTTVTLPNTLPGNYYLIVAVDSGRHVFEGNYESNNTGVTAATFTVIPPEVDLQVTNINVPANSFAGQTMSVSFTVTNTSPAATTATNWTDYVVLSRDLIIDSTDRTLGYFSHNGALASGANYTVTGDVLVPVGLTGEYNVFVVTDRGNNVLESNETNNTSSPDTVILELAPPADLVVETITPLASVIPGESATFSWTGRNAGSNAAIGLWTDSVYLSSNQTWDIDDVLIGQQTQNGTLNPAATYNATLSTVIPAMNPGAYYVIIRTDTRNRVRESNETNNTRVAAATTTADVIELQLGVPRTTTLNTGQEKFYKVAVPANETLLTTLDGETGSNNELYTKYGSMVSRSQYDFFYSRPYEADQETVVPETQAGTYYNLARADFVPSGFAENEAEKGKSVAKSESNNAVENVTIKAETIPFSIRRVSPAITGKDRFTTITVEGAKFAANAQIRLVGANNAVFQPEVVNTSSARIAALFDFKNVPIGNYAVEVVNPGNQITRKDNAVQVVGGGGANVSVQVLGPDSLRPDNFGSYNVLLSNNGRNDSVLTTMLLQVPHGSRVELSQSAYDRIEQRSVLPEGFNSWRDLPLMVERGEFDYLPISIPLIRAGSFKSLSFTITPPSGATNLKVRAIILPSALSLETNVSRILADESSCPTTRGDCAKLIGEKLLDEVYDEIKEELLDLLPADCAREIIDFYAADYPKTIIKENLGLSESEEDAGWLPTLWSYIPPVSLVEECGSDLLKKFPLIKVGLEIVEVINEAMDLSEDISNVYNKCLKLLDGSSAGGGSCGDPGGGGNSKDTPIRRPSDPNDKVGPAGYGAQKFVALNQTLDYRVNFENMPTATAHAQRIRITDQLPATLDARTLRLKEIGFGNYRFSVPDNRAFYQNRAQLGADLNNLLVEISAGLDVSNGRVTWTLTAIDPATGEQPTNPNAGLLPPNDANNSGQGYVLFTVRPKQNGMTGTALTNNATIIFDTEPPIITNTVSNTLDADLPTSQITALPTSSGTPTFNLSWAGSDPVNGSGLASYDVWVAENDQAYTLFKSATTETSAEFVGRYGITYSFYSTARDNAGNVEAAPDNPDTVTTVVGGAYEADVAPRPNGNNDGTVNDDDVSLIRRFVAGLDGNFIYNEAQRADSAPLAARGNDILSMADVMQARRFALGLDSVIFTEGRSVSNFAVKSAAQTMTGAAHEIRPYRISHIASKLRIGINLESPGGATGAGFTLTFDPAVLSNPSVSPGSDGADTTLTINNSEANQGKLGILIDKSPNQPFAAGIRQLVTVEFDIIPNFPTGTNIGFVSNPVVSEIVNGNADALASVFSPVIIPLAPTSANAMLGGRVTKANGSGIDKARITLTASSGATKRMITSSSGYYRFEDLPVGQSYIVSIQHKTFRFEPPTVVVNLNESREDLDFVARE